MEMVCLDCNWEAMNVTSSYLRIRADDRALVIVPFCHAFGNSILQIHLLAGATFVALFCVPPDDVSPTEPDFAQVCRRELPNYKIPYRIEMLERFPLTTRRESIANHSDAESRHAVQSRTLCYVANDAYPNGTANLSRASVLGKVRIDAEIDLIDSGTLDSLLLVDVIVLIQKMYGVALASSDITRTNFSTISHLARLVANRIEGESHKAA